MSVHKSGKVQTSMSFKHLAIEPRGTVTVMRLNRPPANALELEIAQEFEAAFDATMQDPPKAIVVTGTGSFFSGGLDLKVVPSYSPEQQRAFLTVLNRAAGKLYGCPIPVVGGINGHAIAGGFVFALATDYRVGPTGAAQFGLTEARAGIPFPAAIMAIVKAELAPQDVRYTTIYARRFGIGRGSATRRAGRAPAAGGRARTRPRGGPRHGDDAPGQLPAHQAPGASGGDRPNRRDQRHRLGPDA